MQGHDTTDTIKMENMDATELKKLLKLNPNLKQEIIPLLKELQLKEKKYVIKTPKGTRDFNEQEMAIREFMFSTIKNIFQKHGAVTIDTPVFELKEILTGKYGEDSKLIYDLQDQGGELCSLRYDLTVPFARYCALNKLDQIKRYQIAKVYRRDNISIQKGRMREFFQCDFDIAGTYDLMIPDANCLYILQEILNTLDLGSFIIKINHRMILDGIFEHCGVGVDLIRPISSCIDKLDKLEWDQVKQEMIQKGCSESVCDLIHTWVTKSGSLELIQELLKSELYTNSKARQGLTEMKLLYEYLESFGITKYVVFDLSLARGLDYYTGVIYEAVLQQTNDETSGIGSIAAGGRYDNLVGMFSGKNVPCVGVSIGIERVYAILSKKLQKRPVTTRVYIASIEGFIHQRLELCQLLWKNGIHADFTMKSKPKIKSQLSAAEKMGCDLVLILGEQEVKDGIVQIKILKENRQESCEISRVAERCVELLK